VLEPDRTIDDLLRHALGEVWEVRQQLDALEADLHDLDAYGRAQERFEALGGWALEARLDEALRRLGVEHLDRRARLGSLSGGEAARCLLGAVVLSEPTVLLLDEPTNHLDRDGRAWLEEWVAGFTGTLLVISHDRDFLDATVERIYELSAGGLEAYEGGYSDYREQREQRRQRLNELVEARPEYVKFDRKLIAGLDGSDSSRRQMVESLVGMCRQLNISTLAEGVETVGEADACRQAGFELMQGYFFGRPAAAGATVAGSGAAVGAEV